jgi:hypothetical protein
MGKLPLRPQSGSSLANERGRKQANMPVIAVRPQMEVGIGPGVKE